GRLQMDLEPIVEQVQAALADIRTDLPLKVAIMGCVVNGPGEADNADVAICAGKGKAVLYRQGQRVGNVSVEQIVPAVLKEVHALIKAR
ncbi:MAG: flavodoxin-dependent (E)-4-hydroxy-3-methylbut-2-enyl-diphosphate synthase, partial [Phycisphaerae bacterium]|nr:flavodoxin-dependent (E)-4-hydroxy-3-methylbut-2-enyl-diphosphate synthase [Phycisphaerae bacterium]